MDPLAIYDYLIRARRRVLDWVRLLSSGDYAREIFPGQRPIAHTLTHMMISEWAYLQRIQERSLPPYEEWRFQDENPPEFSELETAWTAQAVNARETLAAVGDWKRKLEYRVDRDDGGAMIVTASPADIFTQLALHEVHHRAQVMVMLRQLGVGLEDIDFNIMTYVRRAIE